MDNEAEDTTAADSTKKATAWGEREYHSTYEGVRIYCIREDAYTARIGTRWVTPRTLPALQRIIAPEIGQIRALLVHRGLYTLRAEEVLITGVRNHRIVTAEGDKLSEHQPYYVWDGSAAADLEVIRAKIKALMHEADEIEGRLKPLSVDDMRRILREQARQEQSTDLTTADK
jgi:hypothetical protein